MSSSVNSPMPSQFAMDSKSLDSLRVSARDNSPESLKAAAQQFEALFVSMMLKSMRQAGEGFSQGGLLDSEQTKMYTSMFDQQIAQKMASRGIGLADAMLRQLNQGLAQQNLDSMSDSSPLPLGGLAGLGHIKNNRAVSAVDGLDSEQLILQKKIQQKMADAMFNTEMPSSHALSQSSSKQVQAFTEKLAPFAEMASQVNGVPAKFMLAQAALETGWGKKEMKSANGENSFNLFGIKAGGSWKGKTVDVLTTEYANGVAYQKVERFRAYDNYAHAFQDYARLISENPRYQNVMNHAGDPRAFAEGLQKAGYATDPRYAQKIMSIIQNSFSGVK